MVNRQCAQWALAVCAVVWSVVVLWGSPATAAPLELKGKFEVLKGEVSTHTPGKVKLIEFADFYCPHCHRFDGEACHCWRKSSATSLRSRWWGSR